MSEEPSALEARGLTKRYRDVVALSECSFQLPAHRIIALVGANGAGKSTLMSIAAGLLPATSGEVLAGCPAGSAPRSPSRSRSAAAPMCYCWTNRWRTWTPSPAARSPGS